MYNSEAMGNILTTVTGFAAPVFLILSPILSYADQAISMQRKRSSAGFSLDIPLIMLVASICRVFYWPGARYDTALLIQSFCNIFMQLILLKVALDHRPAHSSKGGEAAVPFIGAQDGRSGFQRPYNFWQWRSPRPYWQSLLYFFIGLTVLELLLAPFSGIYPAYSSFIGYVGLSVEATLPIPQLLANARTRTSRGLRVSVLASWIIGDMMKMFWFFTSTTEIPWSFKICGMFQAGCDLLLGVQYLMWGNNETPAGLQQRWTYAGVRPHLQGRSPSGLGSPMAMDRRSPFAEKTT